MADITYRIAQVFVAGGQPSLTYVERAAPEASQSLEERMRNCLDTGFKPLTVTGPTKSGKTVL